MASLNVITAQSRIYERLSVGALFPDQEISRRVGLNLQLALGIEYFPVRDS